jgi:coenzyme F420 hydrogenase subunit beta
MRISSFSQMRPVVKNAVDNFIMEKIRAVCPGISLTGPNKSQVDDTGVMHALWGPIRSMSRGWSTNEGMRFQSAAGGAMTALGCYLLETGKVDAVVHVRASVEAPLLTDALVSRSLTDIRSGSQSRYGPAAPLRHIKQLLDEGIRFAVLAKPCDVGAIRNLAKIDSRVEKQIPYLISNFCGGVPTVDTASKIVTYHGLRDDQVKIFRWRGNGWPGPTHIETKDDQVFDLTYKQVWFDEGYPWTYDMQFRCKICQDAISELADVSCPDAWEMDGDIPLHDEAPGANLFIARTITGEQLIQDALAYGAIENHPFSIEELDTMHDDHFPRKIETPSRIEALIEEQQPATVFTNYRSREMTALLGPENTIRTKQETKHRIKAGRNIEPVR